jgi:hypothetical protein
VTIDELIEQACPLISYVGGLFYFAPQTLKRGSELGLTPSQFYFLGRGGALGDVSAVVADSALGYFAPSVIPQHWNSGRTILSPHKVASAYMGCCQNFGRQHLQNGGDWLGPFCEAASMILRAANTAALPLFAGAKEHPFAEDLPARAMQLVTVLREFRGGMHLLAIVAAGIEPKVAHWLTRPDAWANFGYSTDQIPDVTEEDRQRLRQSDEITDRLMVPAFSVLGEDAAAALMAGLSEMKARLPVPELPG